MSWFSNGLALLRDERIAPLAVSALPAWLWSLDASRILWANPTGAAVFGGATSSSIGTRKFDAGQPAAAQIAQLVSTLPHDGTPQSVQLRGFGAGIGRALTCECSRFALPDGRKAILVVATQRAGPTLSLEKRVARLLAECDQPAAIFSVDGRLLHATLAAASFLQGAKSLGSLGITATAQDAGMIGHRDDHASHCRVRLDRLGQDSDAVLLVTPGRHGELEPPTAETRETVSAIPSIAADAATLEPSGPATSTDDPPIANLSVPEPKETAAPAFTGTEEESGAIDTIGLAPVAAPAVTEPASEPAPAEPAAAEPAPALVEPEPVVTAVLETIASVETAVAEPPQPAKKTETNPPPPFTERRHPLRFVWQIDADGRFTLCSDEFVALAGPSTASLLGRTWSEIATKLVLDPEQSVARALATHDTWSGLTVAWPIDGNADRLTVELSGLPSFDRERQFRGYRGFGVCRDVDRLNELARMRSTAAPAAIEMTTTAAPDVSPSSSPLPPPEPEQPSPEPQPPSTESEAPTLTTVEHHAFYELSRRLTHLNHDDAAFDGAILESASLLSPSGDMRQLFDRLPVGIMIYRLEQLIYANRSFLLAVGYDSLDELIEAGGLDSLLIASDSAKFEADPGKPSALTIVGRDGGNHIDIELVPVLWEDEAAHALMVQSRAAKAETKSIETESPEHNTLQAAADPDAIAAAKLAVAQAQAETAEADVLATKAEADAAQAQADAATARGETAELREILETATDGVVLLDRAGSILSANRSAEALFGYDASALAGRPFLELFAPESVDAVATCLESACESGVASMLNSSRDVTGRVRRGGRVPLSMSLGRLGSDAGRLCAVFRDVTPWKKAEADLLAAKLRAEKASSAKSELLAKISHEIRTPLNAIIGFSEVMMEERFGPMANDRYRDYVKDIHASGGHLMELINDLLDLSKIEAGKLELTFGTVSLNDLVQQCATLMQPQANRAQIIVRTSLPSGLPHVFADARSLRQIVLNLLSNSIKFTEAGGQVIVSTALSDEGVALRVRDSGIGMSEADIATALEPFRQIETTIAGRAGGTGLGLPLTKALAEANHGRFRIKSTPKEGTLVEVVFPTAQEPVD